jgi:hypothetical protein
LKHGSGLKPELDAVTEVSPSIVKPLHRLEARVALLRVAMHRPKARLAILLFAASLFVVGGWLSFRGLAFSPTELRTEPLLILGLLTIPSLLYGGIGLILLARSSQLSIPLGKATVIGANAYLAELLPLPGGAIVRIDALMKAGGTIRQSSALVVSTAVLWISLGMAGAGLSLVSTGLFVAFPLALIGAGLAIAILTWLWRLAGPALAIQTLIHRLTGIILIALRLKFAFAALYISMELSETMPFVLAGLVGSASSIAPSGLGISESLAGLAASSISEFKPEIAFLAVGLDRVICLAACALLAGSARISRHFKSAA